MSTKMPRVIIFSVTGISGFSMSPQTFSRFLFLSSVRSFSRASAGVFASVNRKISSAVGFAILESTSESMMPSSFTSRGLWVANKNSLASPSVVADGGASFPPAPLSASLSSFVRVPFFSKSSLTLAPNVLNSSSRNNFKISSN